MGIDPRFVKKSGREVFKAAELLVKGALEAEGGVHLLTGYPGSSIPGFFDTLKSISELLGEKGIVTKIANNEALSAAMVNGAQMAGCRAITAFQVSGMHVASDALALGVLAGTRGESGGLIICGDDPWGGSTQAATDSHFLAQHLRLPMVEPSCPQEVKDWVNLAFKLGRAGQIYIGYLVTILTAHGGGTVDCYPNQYPTHNEEQKKQLRYERDIEQHLDQTVLRPQRIGQREITLPQRLDTVKAEARRLKVNRILYPPQKGEVVPLGFIASGAAYAYLGHALTEMGLIGRIPILKLGMSYPVDEHLVREFASQVRRMVVVEERRGFVERQIVEILRPLHQTASLSTEIYGKQFPNGLAGFPTTSGLNPSVIIERLAPLIRKHARLPIDLTNGRLSALLERIERTAHVDVDIPDRTPAFCPGCPHRDSSSVLLELRRDLLDPQYMLGKHKRRPVDLIIHGDTGCSSMLMYEPNKPLMCNDSGMGLGGGAASGCDLFIDNKQIVFMGDDTFFHSGQVAISQSIQTGQDVAYIILENKTTAMTGHQTHPDDGRDLTGPPITAQDIERIVKGMVAKATSKDVRIIRINPGERDRFRILLEKTILDDGVKIIIADKECGMTYHLRDRASERQQMSERGFVHKKTHMNVATQVCEFCLECTHHTACPGLKIVDTDYGSKIQTDLSSCVNDGACQRIRACPSFEEVTIIRNKPPRRGDSRMDLSNLPDPPRPFHADQDSWRCHIAGVGGMGIGLCTSILVRAGHRMGYDVQFFDKKGLAIRYGEVVSQVVFTRTPQSKQRRLEPTVVSRKAAPTTTDHTTPVIPYGKADLILGVDVLEATRGIDPKHPYRVACVDRTAAVVNTALTPTVSTLMGQDVLSPRALESTLKRHVHPQRYFGFNVGDLCERVLDSKLYANTMILGIAFQKGFLPLTGNAIESAIRSVIYEETDQHLQAFAIGRKVAIAPERFVVEAPHQHETARKTVRRKSNTLLAIYGSAKRGRRAANQFRVLLKKTLRATRGHTVDDQLLRDVVIRVFDCLTWGGVEYARRYCRRLVEVFEKDDPAFGWAATKAVAENLARVMLIKDEIYVARLLTSPEKYKHDQRRFNVNPNNGDRISYRHHHRPEFEVFGKRFRFEWKSRDWQLRIMARMVGLRRLLPQWHLREKRFRDWYESMVDRFEYRGPRDYQRWLAILSVPEEVRGFREVRYPKMEAARRRAEALLETDPQLFEPDGGVLTRQPVDAGHVVHLPVIGAGIAWRTYSEAYLSSTDQ